MDLNALISGYNPSQYGYARNTDGSKPNGWYLNGAENPSDPYGGGTAFDNYLTSNGVGMWDPGNPVWGRVGVTNKQAFDYLNPGATILGQGGIGANGGFDPNGGQMQFYTGGGPALGTALANRDYGDNTGINKLVSTIGPMIPLALAGGAAAGLFSGTGAGAGLGAEALGGELYGPMLDSATGAFDMGGSLGFGGSTPLTSTLGGGASMFDFNDPTSWFNPDGTFTDAAKAANLGSGADLGLGNGEGLGIPGGTTLTSGGSSVLDYIKKLLPSGSGGSGGAAGGGTDYSRILGSLLSGSLGILGSNAQRSSNNALADKFLALGAPSRARYEASMTPGFDASSIPGFQSAMDWGAKSSMNALSTQGNPIGSPNAWNQTLSDVTAKIGLPAIQNYQAQNANAGGISSFTPAGIGAMNNSAQSTTNMYNAAGSSLNDIFNPKPSLAQTLAQYKTLIG